MSHGEVFDSGTIVAGRYRVMRVLGVGGMGAVYEAENRVTGRPVALKIPWKRYAEDAVYRARFLREARAASALSHPNVIDILDVAEHGALPVLVMELLRGGTLAASIADNGRLTLGEAASHLVPVLDAVAIAHELGIIHRDLKPENIFLSDHPDGGMIPKLLDFGIVKLSPGATGSEPSGTATGTVLGTPFYMAPEQVGGVKDLDGRVDVWAAGAVTYECLSGKKPFPGENFGQIFAAILQTEPERLEVMLPSVPEAVASAVHDAMTRDRDRRPATVEPLALALEPFVYEHVRRTRTARSSRPPPRLSVRPDAGGESGQSDETFAMSDTAAGPGESLEQKAEAPTAEVPQSDAPPPLKREEGLEDSPPPAARAARIWPVAAAAIVGGGIAAALLMGREKAPAGPTVTTATSASAAASSAGAVATATASATAMPSAAPLATAPPATTTASAPPIRRPAAPAASARAPVTTAVPTAPGGLLRDPNY